MRKKILVFAMCAVLACMLSGCGRTAGDAVSNAASKLGEAVSRAGEGMSEAASRITSSQYDGSSMMGDSSTVDSGTDGFLSSSSRLDGDSSFIRDESSAFIRDDDSSLGSASSGLS